jgi:hypothetical protein
MGAMGAMNMMDILKNIACNADQSDADRLEAEAQLKVYGAHPLDNRSRQPVYYFMEEAERVYTESRHLIHDMLVEIVCDGDEEPLVRELAERKLELYEEVPW